MINPAKPVGKAATCDDAVRPTAVLWLALLVVAVVVIVQAALGFAGHLSAAPALVLAIILVVAGMVLVAAVRRGRLHRRPTATRARPWSRADAALATAFVAAIAERIWTGLHPTTFLYDVLSYQLHLPASWRAAGKLQIVPTPFGDQAPAYAPGNAELIHHLALALTGNAALAHASQAPFAALAGLAIYASARLLGAARATGFAAALGFLLIPEVWQQASTGMADLVLASLFLAAIPFLLRLGRQRTWPDVIGLGLALGLMVGTKYVAAVLCAPIVVWSGFALFRRGPGPLPGPTPGPTPRPMPVAALGIVAVLVLGCGGFWYVRNAVATGNPLFPVTIRLGPFTLARGLYDTALMRSWSYHLPILDLHALLEILTDIGWGFLVATAMAMGIARRSFWPPLALVLTSIVWCIVPYQEPRFFFCAWGVCAILLAVAATRAPRLGPVVLAFATGGAILEFPTPARLGLLGVAAVGAILTPILAPSAKHFAATARRRSPAALFAGSGALVVVALAATLAWARTRSEPAPYAVGDYHDAGWAWITANLHAARIAYAGSNLPLPLWGPRFENDVRYVNVSGGPTALLHDFRNAPAPEPPTPEPAPERATPDQGTWLANLDVHRIDILFVAALYPILRDTIGHDDSWFPIERTWADACPDRFSLLYANAGIRIYGHHQPATAEEVPASHRATGPTARGGHP